jgi:hypothetical protein
MLVQALKPSLQPNCAWLKGQRDRQVLEMFLAVQGLPALAAGSPRSDVDNIAQATQFLLMQGQRAHRIEATRPRNDAYYASLARIACEIAEELASQLDNRGAWPMSATIAICAILHTLVGYTMTDVVGTAVSEFRRSAGFLAQPRQSSAIARQAGKAIHGSDTDIDFVIQLIALELSTFDVVAG